MYLNVKYCMWVEIILMNGEPLATVKHERDIGVIIDETLKPSKQCSEAARRATTVQCMSQISRVFMYPDKKTCLQLGLWVILSC